MSEVKVTPPQRDRRFNAMDTHYNRMQPTYDSLTITRAQWNSNHVYIVLIEDLTDLTNWRESSKSNLLQPGAAQPWHILTFIAISHHGLNPMNIRAKAPQFDLLTFARLNCQRICIHPLICRHIGRLGCICEDVEHSGFVYDREEGDRRHYLF